VKETEVIGIDAVDVMVTASPLTSRHERVKREMRIVINKYRDRIGNAPFIAGAKSTTPPVVPSKL